MTVGAIISMLAFPAEVETAQLTLAGDGALGPWLETGGYVSK